MKRSILPALILCLGLVSVAQGQDGRPVEERVRPSSRASAADPDSPVMTLVLSQENQTAQPRLVKFGGVLTDSMGRPLSGEAEVTFSLYKQETDEEPLWKETQKLDVDKQGAYTALIGVTQPGGVPVELFRSDEARWLAVQIQGEPQRPRILLVSVPYALKAVEAEKLGGKSASDFVLSESLGEQVRQVIEAQTTVVAGQATSTGTLQQGQTKSNSALTPQITAAGPMFPPSTFSGTNSTQIVRVQQNGSGNGLYAQTASSTGGNGVAGNATATSGYANGVFGQSASTSGTGVTGYAPTTGIFGDATATSGFTSGVSGQTSSPNGAGVNSNNTSATGFATGVTGVSASMNGNGVFGNATATSGLANGVLGQTASSTQFASGVVGFATAATGGVFGVSGTSESSSGTGVNGFASSPTGSTIGIGGFAGSDAGSAVLGYESSPIGQVYGVWGGTSSSSGTGVAGFNFGSSGFTKGVFGQSSSPNGTGVFGNATSSNGQASGVYGQTVNWVGVGGQALATSGGPAYGVWGDSVSTNGTGVAAFEDATSGGTTGVFAQVASPNGNAVFAHAGAPTGGVGVVGFTEGPNAVAGQFVAHGGSGLILQGLSGSNFNQVFSVDANGNLNISGNLTVSGTKSSTAKLQNGREVALYAVESPENWFEDFGSAEMHNGVAWVPLEASFDEATNSAIAYHVFLTANGDSNGLYVSRKTTAGFEVREHGGGSNVAFDYRIVVRRRGYETMRMAEVHEDVKTIESSRQHLAELANSGSLAKAVVVKPPRTTTAPVIRPIPPRPIVPPTPKLNVPQPSQPR